MPGGPGRLFSKKADASPPCGRPGRARRLFMTTIMPQSELVRRAAAYVAAELAQKGRTGLSDLLDDAAMRFNLTPLDQLSLERLFSEQNGESDALSQSPHAVS